MAFDGSLNFDTKISTDGFNKGTKEITKEAESVSSKIKKIFSKSFSSIPKMFNGIANSFKNVSKQFSGLGAVAGKTLALLGFGKLIKETMTLGKELQSAEESVRLIFGNMAKYIDKFSKDAITSIGLSESTVKKFAETIGTVLEPTGLSTEAITKMTIELTKLSSAMQAATGESLETVQVDLANFFGDNSKALKKYGVIVTKSNLATFALSQGIKKTVDSMSEAEIKALKYQYAMAKLQPLMAGLSERQNTYAYQTRLLSEQWKELLSVIGKQLIQTLTPAIKFLNILLAAVLKVVKGFIALYTAITGQQISMQDQATEAIGDSTAAEKKFGKEVGKTNKKLQGTLAAFDEINVLQEKTQDIAGSGEDVGGGIANIGLDVKLEETKIEYEVPEFVKKILEFFEPLSKIDMTNFLNALDRMKIAFDNLATATFDNLVYFYEKVIVPLSKWAAETFLPNIMNTLANTMQKLSEIDLKPFSDAVAGLVTELTKWGDLGTDVFDWFMEHIFNPLAKWTSEKLAVSFIKLLTEALGLLYDLLIEFKPLGVWLWEQFLKPLGEWTGGVVIATIDGFTESLKKIRTSMKENKEEWNAAEIAVAGFGLAILIAWGYVNGIKPAIAALKGAVVLLKDSTILMTAWEWLATAATWAWNAAAWALGVAIAIIESPITLVIAAILALIAIGIALYENWDKIMEVGGKVFDWLKKTLDKILTKCGKIIDGIKDLFKKAANAIIGIFEDVINYIIRGINSLANLLNSALSFELPAWMGGYKFSVNIPPIEEIKLPRLASGAVIPPNSEFLAILGDQKQGKNIEAPESLIRKIVREEMGGNEVNINFSGNLAALGRLLKVEIDRENRRLGKSIAIRGALV